MSPDILARLRKAAPNTKVAALRFKVGPLPEIPLRRVRPQPKPFKVELAALPDELGRALARVNDDELRQRIALAATTSLTHRPE